MACAEKLSSGKRQGAWSEGRATRRQSAINDQPVELSAVTHKQHISNSVATIRGCLSSVDTEILVDSMVPTIIIKQTRTNFQCC